MEEEIKKKYEHHLVCDSCNQRFSILSEYRNNTKLDFSKIFCPHCGKQEILLDPAFFYVSTELSTESQRRLNIEASQYALKLAAEQKARDKEMGLDKEIIINPPAGEEYKPSFRIPEKVVKSISKKVEPDIEKLIE